MGFSNSFMLSIYPVIGVNAQSAPPFDPRLAQKPFYLGTRQYVASRLFEEWQRNPGLDRIAGIVPKDWLGPGVLGGADFTQYLSNWGQGRVVLIAEDAHGTILSHETAHTYGFDDEYSVLTDIDGFRLRARGMRGQNRSIPEGSLVTSVMYDRPDPPGAGWIRNAPYDSLVSSMGVLAPSLSASSTQYLLVSGAIDENDNVYLNPWRIQDFANMTPQLVPSQSSSRMALGPS